MPSAKSKYEVTVRDNTGNDRTVEVEGTSAEQDAAGRLTIKDGDEQVAGFISVVGWQKLSK